MTNAQHTDKRTGIVYQQPQPQPQPQQQQQPQQQPQTYIDAFIPASFLNHYFDDGRTASI